MGIQRREWLQRSGLALFGGGFLSRFDRVASAQPAAGSLTAALNAQASGRSEKLLLKATAGEEGPPPPTRDDRLSLAWNRATVARFKEKLLEKDARAFLIRDPLNIVYLTGYWHTTTERPQAVFMNHDDADPWYFYPALDRDLVRSWWFGGGRMYFDYLHGDGAFPHEGKVQMGETVDLTSFMFEGLREKKVQGNRIAVDGDVSAGDLEKARRFLPGVEFVDVSDVLMKMRQVKTPEELALWRRAYAYFDRGHAFARDYILTHGTDVTDYEVGTATTLWISTLLYADLDLAGGQPHHGVGANIGFGVRVGAVTGYPHPNQPYFNRVGRGMALQVAGGASIGGYGGECYRAYIIPDASGRIDPNMKKLWEVSRNSCHLQLENSMEGLTCSTVAYRIHKYQTEQGVQQYVYHRPAHGSGVEGHQSPYITLGDHTMLRRNMCFSEEPGLYDPAHGYGFNWSDTIVVATRAGYRMSRVPYDEEWCTLKI